MYRMPSAPRFAWSFNGTHTFEWKSVYACPDTLVPQPPGNGNGNGHEMDEDGVNPPADPDSDSGEPVDPTHASHGSVVGPLPILKGEHPFRPCSVQLFDSDMRWWDGGRNWKTRIQSFMLAFQVTVKQSNIGNVHSY